MNKSNFIENQISYINKVCELHKHIKDLNQSLQEFHPIAIVNNNEFFVFDINPQDNSYEFVMEYPFSWPIPDKVLAAFPLDFYQNKMAAVVSASILENPDNYVFVYHEFVHCYIWNKYECNIRKELEIEKQQKKENNFSWEINYPFPYKDDVFVKMTAELDNIPCETRFENFITYHKKMKDYLNEIDFEYMIWQEWKEGFARYVENLIREKLAMKKNTNILNPPFDRVCFYEIGNKYIEAFFKADKTLITNMDKLLYKMMLR